jgi:phosphoserine phosphatase
MRVALFLDVDNTLTPSPIQGYFARALGVYDQYLKLEDQFQNETMSSNDFGRELVALFASQRFNSGKAAEVFGSVPLQPWADGLFALQKHEKVHVYLVSNGPSYYITELALKRDVPPQRVCCSQYFFQAPGNVISSCNAVSDQGKAEFVRIAAANYPISIGIGDSPEHDGPFIAQCTFGFLTVRTDSYPHIPSFEHIINLVSKLVKIPDSAESVRRDKVVDLPALPPRDLIKSLTTRSWLTLGTVVAAAFAAGAISGKLKLPF